jgi:hypothetical protein
MQKLKKITSVVLVGILVIVLSGCYTHIHNVGRGAQGGEVSETRQWYILWGLVPIANAPDTTEKAGSATDYTIRSEITALDGVINFFTSIATVHCRTVTITK